MRLLVRRESEEARLARRRVEEECVSVAGCAPPYPTPVAFPAACTEYAAFALGITRTEYVTGSGGSNVAHTSKSCQTLIVQLASERAALTGARDPSRN